MLYMETGQNQKARTLLEEWEARYPGDPLSFHLYMNYLDDPRAGLRVLDQVIQANPGEPGLIQLRDSIKQANNL
jgi:hypothetical protein